MTAWWSRPLAVGCACFAAGAWAGVALVATDAGARSAALFAAAVACSLAALAIAAFLRPRLRALAPPLGLLVLGVLRALAAGPPARDGPLEAKLEALREPIVVEALVLESERAAADRRRLLLQIERREREPGAPIEAISPVRALVSLTESGGRDPPRPGDRVRLFARLRLPRPQLNPGGSNERRDLAQRGVAYAGNARDDGLVLLARGPPWRRKLAELRERFAERCLEVCASRERGALVAALAVGLRADLPASVDRELAASGLIHLLASAGLHVAAVCLAIQWLAARLWLRTRWAARARAGAIGAVAALPFAAAEALLLGAGWPAVRAAVSAALWLLAGAFGRRSDSITALALSAALCALVEPAALHDLPLLLSLAGVAGLIFLAAPLRELIPVQRTFTRLGALREHALRAACATAAASLCTAPLQAAAFHRLSIVGVLANALALWPGLCAIPVATAAAALHAIAPASTAALVPLWLADLCAGLTLRAAALFASLPGAQIALRGPGLMTALLWAAALLAFAGWPGPIGPGSALLRLPLRLRLRRMAWPLGAIVLTQLSQLAWARLDRSLRVTFFAVGQGDAALLRFPGGRTMLIDAGGSLFAPSTGEPIDAGARELLPAFAELGVDRLDWAVLTHPHPDHAGGLFALLPRVPAHEVWTTGEPGPGALGLAVRALAQRTGARLAVPIAGQHLDEAGVHVEILHPRRWSEGRSTNDNSLVLRVTHGAVSLLFAGDLEALAEAELAQSGQPLRADLLKAPHHGSRTSSTEAFLSKVRPRHVVFCVGAQNPFGFPHEDVVERYRAQGCSLFRTDRGAVTAESDGERLRLDQWSG